LRILGNKGDLLRRFQSHHSSKSDTTDVEEEPRRLDEVTSIYVARNLARQDW
jgi:hypothetical protein